MGRIRSTKKAESDFLVCGGQQGLTTSPSVSNSAPYVKLAPIKIDPLFRFINRTSHAEIGRGGDIVFILAAQFSLGITELGVLLNIFIQIL